MEPPQENHPRSKSTHVRRVKRKKAILISPELKDYLIDLKDFQLEKKIGSGTFGEVWRAKGNDEKGTAAIKILFNEELSKAELKHFLMEVEILVRCQSRFVIPFVGFTNTYPYAVATRLATNGNLADFIGIMRNQGKYPSTIFQRIAIGIAVGMQYLHNLGIIHRDLKPSNILLNKNYLPLICDFGVSRNTLSNVMTKCTGTPQWMAPEIVAGSEYSLSADIFSYGMILYEIATLTRPFEGIPVSTILREVLKGTRPTLPTNIHPGMRELIIRCWMSDPRLRPSFKEIINLLCDFRAVFPGYNEAKVNDFISTLPAVRIMRLNDYSDDETKMDMSESVASTDEVEYDFEKFLAHPRFIKQPKIAQFLSEASQLLQTAPSDEKSSRVVSVINQFLLDKKFVPNIIESNIYKYLPISFCREKCVKVLCKLVAFTDDQTDLIIQQILLSMINKYPTDIISILYKVAKRSRASPALKILVSDWRLLIYDNTKEKFFDLLLAILDENPLWDERTRGMFQDMLADSEDYTIISSSYDGLCLTKQWDVELNLKSLLKHLSTDETVESTLKYLKNAENFPINSRIIHAIIKAARIFKIANKILISLFDDSYVINYFINNPDWIEFDLPDQSSTAKLMSKLAEVAPEKAFTLPYLPTFLEVISETLPSSAIATLYPLKPNDEFVEKIKNSKIVSNIVLKDEDSTELLNFIKDKPEYASVRFEFAAPKLIQLLKNKQTMLLAAEALTTLCSKDKNAAKILSRQRLDNAAKELIKSNPPNKEKLQALMAVL